MFLSGAPFEGTARGISSLVSLFVFKTATQKQAELASGSTLTIEKWKAEQTATVGKNSNLSIRPRCRSAAGDEYICEQAKCFMNE